MHLTVKNIKCIKGKINIRSIFKIMTGNKITIMGLLVFFSKCYYSDISGVVLFCKKMFARKVLALPQGIKKKRNFQKCS